MKTAAQNGNQRSMSHVQDCYGKDSRLLDVTIGKDEVVEEHSVGIVVSVEVQLFVQSSVVSLRVFRTTCIRMPSFTQLIFSFFFFIGCIQLYCSVNRIDR